MSPRVNVLHEHSVPVVDIPQWGYGWSLNGATQRYEARPLWGRIESAAPRIDTKGQEYLGVATNSDANGALSFTRPDFANGGELAHTVTLSRSLPEGAPCPYCDAERAAEAASPEGVTS